MPLPVMAVLFVFPDDETLFVFTVNMGNAPIQGIPRKVVELVLGESWE